MEYLLFGVVVHKFIRPSNFSSNSVIFADSARSSDTNLISFKQSSVFSLNVNILIVVSQEAVQREIPALYVIFLTTHFDDTLAVL